MTLLKENSQKNELFNVNFPKAFPHEVKGILWNRTIAPTMFYTDSFTIEENEDGSVNVTEGSTPVGRELVPQGTDIDAVYNKYISIGKVKNPVMVL